MVPAASTQASSVPPHQRYRYHTGPSCQAPDSTIQGCGGGGDRKLFTNKIINLNKLLISNIRKSLCSIIEWLRAGLFPQAYMIHQLGSFQAKSIGSSLSGGLYDSGQALCKQQSPCREAQAFNSPNTCLLPELHSILDCSNSQIGTKTETLRKLKERSTPFFLAIRVSFPPFPPKPPTTYLLTMISEAGVFMRLCWILQSPMTSTIPRNTLWGTNCFQSHTLQDTLHVPLKLKASRRWADRYSSVLTVRLCGAFQLKVEVGGVQPVQPTWACFSCYFSRAQMLNSNHWPAF